MIEAALSVIHGTIEDRPAATYAVTAITPMAMLNQAVARGDAPETIERLMNLYERWETSQARKAFDAALAAAKAEIPVISKNKLVDFPTDNGRSRTTYRHEDLGEIARTVDPILARHGLSYRYHTTSEINQPISVTCIVSHRDGHSEKNTLTGPRDDSGKKNAIQQMGSTLTYLQRYTLKAALGLAAAADDDGATSEEAPSFITEEQVMELRDLLLSVEANESKFVQFIKVDQLGDIVADKFEEAKALILQKAKR